MRAGRGPCSCSSLWPAEPRRVSQGHGPVGQGRLRRWSSTGGPGGWRDEQGSGTVAVGDGVFPELQLTATTLTRCCCWWWQPPLEVPLQGRHLLDLDFLKTSS